MPHTRYGPWPTPAQRLLLDAALCEVPRSLLAFQEWLRSVDLKKEVGWSSLRILPLAYRNLSRHGCTDPRMALLKGVYRRVWSETNQLFHRTEPVLRSLRDNGVEVLLLKGAPIALGYYRNLSLRAMSDLDVCIRIEQVHASARILMKSGWNPRVPIDPRIKYSHSVEFEHKRLGTIDLHWHILKEAPHEDADAGFWAASEPLEFVGLPVRQLHPEDALLHTVIHGLCSNPDPPIRWITDSLAILAARGGDIEWPRLLASAERHRVLHRFALGIQYIAEHHEAPVPATHMETIRSTRPTWIERMEEWRLHKSHARTHLGWDWTHTFVRYCRYVRTRNPLKFACGYFAYRYRVETPREVAVALAKEAATTLHRLFPSRARTLEQLRFAWRYYSPRTGSLAISTLATALQSLLFIPALLLVRRAFDTAIPRGDVTGLVWIGLGIVLIRAATSGLSLLLRAYMLRATRGAVAELRGDLMARLYSLSRRYFTRADYANLHTRIVQDTQRIETISQKLFSNALPAFLTVPVLAGVLLYLDWRLALLGLLLVPLLWFATRITSRNVRNQVVRNQRAFERFSKGVRFAISHVDLTRVRAYEKDEVARQRSAINGLSETGHNMAMAFATHGQVQHTITNFGGICLLVAGGALVASGGMTIGELLAFFVAANQLGGYANTVLGSIPDVIAVSQYLATLQDVMMRGEPEPYSGKQNPDLRAGIAVRNVTFAYEGAPVLRDASLFLPPGSNVAIIGPNGSGKSTLLHLLLGFYRPQAGSLAVGELEYDDVDMRELRRSFGLVPQRPAFFHGTIRENVAYGHPDASENEVTAACQRAHADDFIQRLPQAYETPIGERGYRLSGGECQRLAIARALLGDPRVLVLDEPTNHLDIETVGRLMRELTGNHRTVITISHDPEVVQLADTVYHLAEGKLVSQTLREAAAIEIDSMRKGTVGR
ncbi:MAG TPA: nucleotidyltransferase family protein [Gemmatimonadota bacterium]|nr:nucleotidyltransferase family protein [Gemmatimonadota bacterium]